MNNSYIVIVFFTNYCFINQQEVASFFEVIVTEQVLRYLKMLPNNRFFSKQQVQLLAGTELRCCSMIPKNKFPVGGLLVTCQTAKLYVPAEFRRSATYPAKGAQSHQPSEHFFCEKRLYRRSPINHGFVHKW